MLVVTPGGNDDICRRDPALQFHGQPRHFRAQFVSAASGSVSNDISKEIAFRNCLRIADRQILRWPADWLAPTDSFRRERVDTFVPGPD